MVVAGHPPVFSSHRFPYALGAVETTPPPPHYPSLAASWGSASA